VDQLLFFGLTYDKQSGAVEISSSAENETSTDLGRANKI